MKPDFWVLGLFTPTCLLLHSKLSKSQINTELQQQFKINKRQANSIIAYVEGQVKSARECRSNHLDQLQGKYKHTTEVKTIQNSCIINSCIKDNQWVLPPLSC